MLNRNFVLNIQQQNENVQKSPVAKIILVKNNEESVDIITPMTGNNEDYFTSNTHIDFEQQNLVEKNTTKAT